MYSANAFVNTCKIVSLVFSVRHSLYDAADLIAETSVGEPERQPTEDDCDSDEGTRLPSFLF